MKYLKLMLAAVLAVLFNTSVFAVADADVSAAVGDFDLTWDVIRPVVVSIVLFMLCIGLLKKGARKAG